MTPDRRVQRAFLLVLTAAVLGSLLLTGCRGWDPNEDSAKYGSTYQQTPDGYYRVRKGDTLHAIAFKFGLDWREIARLNGISAPYTIYPDQQLRLSAQASGTSASSTASIGSGSSRTTDSGTVVTAAPARGTSTTTTYDVPARTTTPAPQAETVATPPPPKPAASTPPASSTPRTVSAGPGKWLWPAQGRVISNFRPNDPARKGIDIGGTEGEAVIASAPGEVVYSGSGLIGYGELVIIKHSESLLSAYAHNQRRLVKEGQQVSAGERIADMGRNDRNQAMLHFEIRLNGNPQDPLKYLPPR